MTVPRCLKICPDIWVRLLRHKWPKPWANIEGETHLYEHPLAGLLWDRQLEEVLSELGWEKVPNWKCLFVHRKQRLFLSVCVDDIKMEGKKQTMAPIWKPLMNNVDLDEPTSFLDHACLGCTQRECKSFQRCLNHVFLQEQLKYGSGKSLTQKQ